MMRRLSIYALTFAAAGLFFALVLTTAFFWPVDALEIAEAPSTGENGAVLMRKPSLLGRETTNEIIHSVQLTPVVDIYRVQEGRIWAWREKIQSHNAGLPFLKPERGRFVYDAPWMIVEGGGQSWEEIYYRVGSEELGKNVLCIFTEPCRELWRSIPGKRLVLRVVKQPVGLSFEEHANKSI